MEEARGCILEKRSRYMECRSNNSIPQVVSFTAKKWEGPANCLFTRPFHLVFTMVLEVILVNWIELMAVQLPEDLIGSATVRYSCQNRQLAQ